MIIPDSSVLIMLFEAALGVFFLLCWFGSQFVVLARALLRRASHAKRTYGPLLFVIGHTPHQHACSGAGVSLLAGPDKLDSRSCSSA
jgi:hypothetical protein